MFCEAPPVGQKPANEPRATIRFGVSKESREFRRCGQHADHIQENAACEDAVIDLPRGINAVLREVGRKNLVDRILAVLGRENRR